jgi:hypothetical protein
MNKFSKMNRLTEKAVDLKRIQQTALGDWSRREIRHIVKACGKCHLFAQQTTCCTDVRHITHNYHR